MKPLHYDPQHPYDDLTTSGHNQGHTTPLQPAPQSLFRTMDSLESVVEHGVNLFPTVDRNALYSLLMTYHNTLLDQIEKRAN